MTIHLGKYFGMNWRRMTGSDDRVYLCGVIWYPRSPRRLGYLYSSIRFF